MKKSLKKIKPYLLILFVLFMSCKKEAINISPKIIDQTFLIDENSTEGTLVGQVLAIDSESDVLTYDIISGNTSEAFSISAEDGRITIKNEIAIDYETNPTFTLEVEVKDDRDEGATAIITIKLNNIEISIIDQTFLIDENSQEGIIVGQVIASHSNCDSLTYSIIDGNSNETFSISAKDGKITVQNENALDYETNPKFTLLVEVKDDRNEGASAAIIINLNDIEISTVGLILYLPLNGNAVDESSYNFDGIIHGAIPTVDKNGNENGAFYFDGLDDYIEIGDKKELSFSNNKNYTVSLWAEVKSFDRNQFIISKFYSSGNNKEYSINYTSSIDSYVFGINDGGSSIDYLVSNRTQGWHHIVGMKDNNKIYLFIDNELVSEKIYSTDQLSSFARLIIGAADMSNTSPAGFFHGTIDNIAMYNRSLSNNEIKILFKE